MTIQQLQVRYQVALENRRTAREALRLAQELVDETCRALIEAKAELDEAFKAAFNLPIVEMLEDS